MRRFSIVLLAVVVVVAMATALWRYISEAGRDTDFVVYEVHGEVTLETQRGADDALVGVILAASDRVITGAESRAVLGIGDETRLRLGPSTSVVVQEVGEDAISLELEDGALQATVRPESGAVRIGNRGREVLATNVDFEMGVADAVLQVRATRGSLSLSGVDQTRLEAGHEAMVVDRHAQIGRVPEELLLAVEWPATAKTRREKSEVSGMTAPGAKVTVSGAFGEASAVADESGAFSITVTLLEGDNNVTIEARDALGNQAEVDGALQNRDTKGPTFRGGPKYDQP